MHKGKKPAWMVMVVLGALLSSTPVVANKISVFCYVTGSTANKNLAKGRKIHILSAVFDWNDNFPLSGASLKKIQNDFVGYIRRAYSVDSIVETSLKCETGLDSLAVVKSYAEHDPPYRSRYTIVHTSWGDVQL